MLMSFLVVCVFSTALAQTIGSPTEVIGEQEQSSSREAAAQETTQEMWKGVYRAYLRAREAMPVGINLEGTSVSAKSDIADELGRREQNWMQLQERWGVKGIRIQEFVYMFDQNTSMEAEWESSCILIPAELWLSAFMQTQISVERLRVIEQRIEEELRGHEAYLNSPQQTQLDYLAAVGGRVVCEELLFPEAIWHYLGGPDSGMQPLFFIVRVRDDPFLFLDKARFVAEVPGRARLEPDFVGIRVSSIPGRGNSQWCRYYYVLFPVGFSAEDFVRDEGRLLWWAADTELVIFQFWADRAIQ
jgi:hypothetical protein